MSLFLSSLSLESLENGLEALKRRHGVANEGFFIFGSLQLITP
jgi:hypothetical protein